MLEFEWLQQFGGDSGFGRKLDLDGFQSGPRPQFLLEAHAIAVIAALFAATSNSANQSATGTAATNQSFAAFALPFAGLRIIAGVQVVVAACDGDVGRVRMEETKPDALTLYVEWPGERKKKRPKTSGAREELMRKP
jgi:hypothetical protein